MYDNVRGARLTLEVKEVIIALLQLKVTLCSLLLASVHLGTFL